jgi:replicative DNA helicase
MKERTRNQAAALGGGYALSGERLAFPSGALSFIVAPTGHGKTTFLLNVLLNAAAEYQGKKFHLFSYEEHHDAVIQKALNIYAAGTLPGNENNRALIKAYCAGDEERGRVPEAFIEKEAAFTRELIETGRVNIHYVDKAAPELVEAIRYLKTHSDTGAIFIDYMQLLRKPGRWRARHEELKEICLDLKEVAVEIQIPLILAAQFNRTVENPVDLKAQSIGEAGDIERIANIVLGIWNGEKKAIGDKGKLDLMASKRYGEFDIDGVTATKKKKWYLEILKNRDGRTDVCGFLDFHGNTGKVSNTEGARIW